ncbi:eCIS core domain-containing protein [Roseiflexus sp.]
MIRRTLIARCRRHTRLARALAGRSPLTVRQAVSQPLLWAVGRADTPPRRARAPGLIRFAPDSPAFPDAYAVLPPVAPEEPLVAALPHIPFDEQELREVAGEVQAAPVETASTAPGAPAVETGASPATIIDAARAWVAQQLRDRTNVQSADRSVVQPEPAPDSRPVPAPSLPAEVRVARPPRFIERTPPRRETSPPPQPAAPPDSGAAPSFDRSPAAWMERLRADARRRSEAATQASSAVPEEGTPPEIVASPLQGQAEQARDDRDYHTGMPDSILAPDAAPAQRDAGQDVPAQQSPLPPADVSARAPAAVPTAEPTAPADDTASTFAPPPAVAPASPGMPEAGASSPPDSSAAPAFAPPLAVAPALPDTPEPGAPSPPEGGATPAFAPPLAVAPALPDTPEPGAPALPKSSAAPAFAHPPAATQGSPRAPEESESSPAGLIASPERGSAPVFDRSPAAWMERLRADARRRSEAASQSAPQASGEGATPLTPESAAQPVQRRIERRGGADHERVAAVQGDAGQDVPVRQSTHLDMPARAPEPVAAPVDDDAPEFDRSVEAWMERLRADERRRQKEAAQSPDRSSVEASQPLPDAPPVAQPAGAPQSGGALWVESGRGQQRSWSQPTGASQPGIAASPARATRFAPPVGAAVRSTTPGGARLPARPAPSAPLLSESNRRFLRAAVGVDPATVRIARGPEAGRLTAAYRADAVTFGNDVALAPGRGDETAEGLGLLAHELTHVARRRDPTVIPPIVRPPEQRPGFRPASPGPATDEEALARTVEAQTVRAARMRFAPPVFPARAEAPVAQPFDKQESARTAPPVEDAPAAPERGRWGNLPAPWEPLPDWLAPSRSAEAPPLPVVTVVPAPPAFTTPPQPGAPVVYAAETARTLPAPRQRETPSQEQTPTPAPDIDALARQVYAVLKRRLAAERRRSGWD